MQIHLHAIDRISGDDMHVLGGLAAEVQARLSDDNLVEGSRRTG
jgi:hypothetical protein